MSVSFSLDRSVIRLFRQKLIAASALTLPVLTFTSGLAVSTSAVAAPDYTLPSGATVVDGGITIGAPVSGAMTITQAQQRGLINWNSFNIGTDASVHFDQQQGAGSITVNRVTGPGTDPTSVLGKLTATGTVMVLDRNGVLFGPNSQINVGGIVAAAADLGNQAAYLDGTDNGKISLTNSGTGTIENKGKIAAAGIAALIGKDVKNAGTIEAAKIALAAGMADATVDVDGSGLVEFAVTPQAVASLVENTGTLKADGGVVALTTAGVNVVANSVVNMSGVTTAKSVKVEGGRITLGGSVKTTGGDIKVKSYGKVFDDKVEVAAGAELASDGGDISIDANGHAGGRIDVYGKVNAGTGDVALNGRQNRLLGSSTVTGDTVDFKGGLVNQAAGSTLTANTLTGSMQDRADFRGTNNNIGNIGNFATGLRHSSLGGFTLNDVDGVKVTGALTTDGGDVAIKTNGANWHNVLAVRSTGSIDANGGDVTLDSTGGNLEQWGTIAAGDLSLKGREWLMYNNSTTTADTVDVEAVVVRQHGGTLTAGTLTGRTQMQAFFNNGTNNIGSIGNFATGLAGWHTGGFELNEANGFDVTGTISSDGGAIKIKTGSTVFAEGVNVLAGAGIVSGGGDISIDTNGHTGGRIDVYGTVNAGTGDVALNGRQNRLLGSSTVTGDAVDFKGGLVNQAAGSTLTANTLTGSLQDRADFRGANNNIGSIGNFATGLRHSSDGGFALVNASGKRLDVNGQVSTDGGDVAITHNNRLDVRGSGAIVTEGGDVALTAQGNHFIYVNGLVDTRGAGGNGDVALTSGSNIEMTAATSRIHAGTLTFNSGNIVTQNAAAAIDADKLEGTVDKTLTLNGTANTIRALGNVTTGAHPIASVPGGFKLVNAVDTDVVGAVLGGSGNITLDVTGDVNIVAGGSLDAEGGNINVAQSGTFASVANTLKTSGTGTINVEQREGGSVNQAVNAMANSGTGLNTVSVHAGQYTENVSIADSNLVLKGAQAGVDARDGRPGVAESVLNGYVVVERNVNNVTIDGMTIEGQGTPVAGYGEKGSIVIGVNKDVTIANNIINGNSGAGADGRSGIITSSAGVENVNINNNSFNDLRFGVYVNGNAKNIDVADNAFDGNRYGVELAGAGTTAKVRNNDFANHVTSAMRIYNAPVELSGNTFHNSNTQHIAYLGGAEPDLRVDGATGNRFETADGMKVTDDMTLAQLFALEDKVIHSIDNTAYGTVIFKDGNFYVTDTAGAIVAGLYTANAGSIQRGVDTAAAGDTVWVDAGSFTENVNIGKSLTLNGAQAGVDARGRLGAAESVLNGYIVTGADVDGLTIDGFTIENQGASVPAYGGKGSINLNKNSNVTIANNIFNGNSGAGADGRSGVVTSSAGGEDITITNNSFNDLRFGVYVNPRGERIAITDNAFAGSRYGVVADGVGSLDISGNVIDATLAGVDLRGASDNVTLANNQISGADFGVRTLGSNVGKVTLDSNTFTNNTTGARFESGLVDLGDETSFNTFKGGSVGIAMDPASLPEKMKLANDTLGYTRFEGQADHYVRLAGGAYFVNGTSYLIDALNVDFDGVVPAASTYGSGVLTVWQLRAIESKLWDLDDAPGLGQIFAGYVPGMSTEDMFPNGLGTYGMQGNGFMVTITALPNLGGTTGAQQSLAAALNSLSPAAGGDDAESLAALEPAAGGDEGSSSSCWNDFVNNAGVTTVHYRTGGSMDDTMALEEECGI